MNQGTHISHQLGENSLEQACCMNKTGWPVHLTKFGFTPPSLVCPVHTSKPPCVNLPHHVRQSIQNNVYHREKNINHCYLPFFKNVLFSMLFDMSLLALICEILVAVQLYFLKFDLLGASLRCFGPLLLPVAGVPAPSQGDPWHLRKSDEYVQWPTSSTGLKKGHRGPKKESGKATQLLTQYKRRPWLLFKAVLSECFNLILN